MASQLQLHHDHVDQGGHRRSSGLDDKVGDLAVQRIPDVVQVSQALERIVDLQQRPRMVMAHTAKHVFWSGSEVNHLTPFMQMLAVDLAQNSASASGDHALVCATQVVQHLLLDIAETIFSLSRKKLSNRASQAVLDHMVRIHKGHAQAAGQLPANGGFSRARKAHKDDAHVKSLDKKARWANFAHQSMKCIRPFAKGQATEGQNN
jgi:hypothetical protein